MNQSPNRLTCIFRYEFSQNLSEITNFYKPQSISLFDFNKKSNNHKCLKSYLKKYKLLFPQYFQSILQFIQPSKPIIRLICEFSLSSRYISHFNNSQQQMSQPSKGQASPSCFNLENKQKIPSLLEFIGTSAAPSPSIITNEPQPILSQQVKEQRPKKIKQNSPYFTGTQKPTTPNEFLKFTNEYFTIISEGYQANAEALTLKHVKEIQLNLEIATNCSKLYDQAKQIRLLQEKCANLTQKETELTRENTELKAEIERLKNNDKMEKIDSNVEKMHENAKKKDEKMEKKNPFTEDNKNAQTPNSFQKINPLFNLIVSSTPLFLNLTFAQESYLSESQYLKQLHEILKKINAMINDPEYKVSIPLQNICALEGKAKTLNTFHSDASAYIQNHVKASNLFGGGKSNRYASTSNPFLPLPTNSLKNLRIS